MREEKAVSTVLGIAILVAIVFLVILPLLIFLQNTAALYNLAVSERNRLELERMQERLEVHASISPDNHTLRILLLNNGPLTVNITRVYVMSDSLPTPERDLKERVLLSPSSGVTVLGPNQVNDMPEIEEGSEYFIDVTTSRGKTYSALERPLNITNPPYTLQVSVINMMFDRKYKIKVTVVEMETTNGKFKVGCVLAENSCSSEASYEYYSSTWNDNQTFTFRVMPGNYSIQLTEYKFDEGSGSWISTNRGYQQTLMLLKSSVIVFAYEHVPATPIDLNSQFNMTLDTPHVLMVTDETTFDAYVVIRLDDTVKESMRDATVSLIIDQTKYCTATVEGRDSYNLEIIKPGQTISLHFRIRVSDVDPSLGGVVYIKGSLTSAVGDRTGTLYGYETSITPISVCKLSELQMIKRLAITDNCNKCADECDPYSVIDCIKIIDWLGLDVYLCVCGDSVGVVPRCGQP